MAQRLEENKRQIKLFVFTGAIKGLFSWEKSLFCKLKEISGKYTLPLFFSTCFSAFFKTTSSPPFFSRESERKTVNWSLRERAKRKRAWKSPHARKGDTRRGERKMRDHRQAFELMRCSHFSLSPPRVAFSRVGWFSRTFAFRSLYYPWGKMGDYS